MGKVALAVFIWIKRRPQRLWADFGRGKMQGRKLGWIYKLCLPTTLNGPQAIRKHFYLERCRFLRTRAAIQIQTEASA